MPLVLGVTGAIASGKSHLCRYLVERYGAVHADADTVVHAMYAPGTAAFARIVAEFGDGAVGADGTIDRKVIGGMVFGRPERLQALLAAIGDITAELKRLVEGWRATLPRDQIAILEAVNLIESGHPARCDATWLVAVDDAVALPRLMSRNAFSEADAQQRLASARPWAERAPVADRIFHNNATLADFEVQIDGAMAETLAQHRIDALPPTQWQRRREVAG